MSRPSKLEIYRAILAKYPATMRLDAIARAENINESTFGSYVVKYKLRNRVPRGIKSPLMRRLIGKKTDEQAAAGVISGATMTDWRLGRATPMLDRFVAVAEANGLRLELVEDEPSGLRTLLDKLNAIRATDISGSEACAILTDDVLDLIDAHEIKHRIV